jgi:rSAM/selenodomain-associated transferase 1
MRRAIIIMAKVPIPGTVKTRLQSILSPAQCAALATAFLQDTLEKSVKICKDIILAYSPDNQRELLENLITPGSVLLPQKGENLGERMSDALNFAFRNNSAVVMIGTDSPTFPAEYLARAFAVLEKNAEIVLGKSKDGGFYLIGLRRSMPNILEKITWSTPRVFEEITGNIKSSGIEKLHLLPEHYDVDTPEDFRILKKEIFADRHSQKLAARTYQWFLANRAAI